MRLHWRRLLLLAATHVGAVWILYMLLWGPRAQTVRAAVVVGLNGLGMYPCAFLKQPMLFEHGDRHYYVVWETTCMSNTPLLEWWDDSDDTAPVHHYAEPLHRAIDSRHHRYTAIIGPVAIPSQMHYRVRNYRFSTAAHTITRRARGGQTSVLVMADNQNNPTEFRKVLAGIRGRFNAPGGPDIILHVGDAVQNVRELGDWQEQLFSPLEDGGGLHHHSPIIFVPGNHDHDGRRTPGNRNLYTDMYHGLRTTDDLSSEAVVNGSYHRFFHSVSVGSSRIIVLDAECPSPEQLEFLTRELQSDLFQSARFRIVAVHIPPYMEFWDPYTWNEKGEKHWGEHIRLEYDPLFRRHGVDLVISGHQHNYQRSTIHRSDAAASDNLITYAIVGGAGGDLDLKRVEDWHMYNKTYLDHHFVSLDIGEHHLRWAAFSATGRIIDRFDIRR
ncbi:hypothetical protein GGF46_002422 [Coemansia sp. RSA 552]|nr:hypothetical protein GGF46_002422 [Coemansia sp. RSA 552]